MKNPLMLRTIHEKEIRVRDQEVTRLLGELRGANKSLSALENRNCQLHTRLIATDDKVEKLEDVNNELYSDLKDAKTTIKQMMEQINKLEKEKLEAKFCAGTAKTVIEKLNKKLKVNTEAKRQIRDLVAYKDNTGKAVKTEQGSWVHEKIDGKKVWDLTMLIGE